MWPPHPLLGATVCVALAGCASLPPPPVPSDPITYVATGLQADPAPAFLLRPGDGVRVDGQTESGPQSWEAILDAQGMVLFSGIGSANLGGLSLAQAESRVLALIRQRDRLATVTLFATATAGQRATVLGAVANQGSVPVAPNMRVAELIADSGGVLSSPDPVTSAPLSLADLERATLTRSGRQLPISVARAMLGDPRHNVFVHAGDHLFVPRREHGSVSIFGQVGAPGVFVHRSGLRMTEALALAGGITTGGDKSDIRLLRGPVEEPAVYRADLAAIVDGDGPDVSLQAGDVLFVTDDPIEDVGEVFGLLMPLAALSTGTLLLAIVLAAQ
jgi:polysaccharide export outer membrane protein